MKFRYQLLYGRLLPLVDIKLKRGHKSISTIAYVDSGALDSIFNAELAKLLGIDYKKGKKILPLGLGGHITAYLNDVTIIIGDKEIQTKVLFSNEIKFSFNLLGIRSFFSYFRICFDDKKGELTLSPYKK